MNIWTIITIKTYKYLIILIEIFYAFVTLLCLTFKQPVCYGGGLRVKVDADLIADSRAREGF